MRESGFGDPEHGVDVGAEGGVELFGGDVEDGFLVDLFGGIVDEDVETAEGAGGVFDKFEAEGFVADVAGECDGFSSFGADEVDDFLGVGFFNGEVPDGDVGTFACEGDGGGAANAGVAAGDECFAAGEFAGAFVGGFAVVRAGVHFGGEAWGALGLSFEGRLGVFVERVLEWGGGGLRGLLSGGEGGFGEGSQQGGSEDGGA